MFEIDVVVRAHFSKPLHAKTRKDPEANQQ